MGTKIPASEVEPGMVVKVRDETPNGVAPLEVRVERIVKGKPKAGFRTWYDVRGLQVVISNGINVEVIFKGVNK